MLYRSIFQFLFNLLKFLSFFSLKINKLLRTRLNINSKISKSFSKNDNVIWFHCSSLGEFEQARPLIELYSKNYSNYKILLTFFSSSGYEIQKNYKHADCVSYLPFDNQKTIISFLNNFNPKVLFLIKYEFWPELINQLYIKKIKIFSISSIFRKDQIFFKFYGKFLVKYLKKIDHFFVQDDNSKNLLNSIGISSSTVIGDTRLDRVLKIKNEIFELKAISKFKASSPCLVLGSTWKEDYFLLNKLKLFPKLKTIIVPHKIDTNSLKELTRKLKMPYSMLSSYKKDNSKSQILVIDSIGLLSKIYKYADIAYVGGGMGKKGLHNTMEPAVFNIPIIVGKNYNKYNEVIDLVKLGGIISVKNENEFYKIISLLLKDSIKRNKLGKINSEYINSKAGSSKTIINLIKL